MCCVGYVVQLDSSYPLPQKSLVGSLAWPVGQGRFDLLVVFAF